MSLYPFLVLMLMLLYLDYLPAVVFPQYDKHLIDPFEGGYTLLVHRLMYRYLHRSKDEQNEDFVVFFCRHELVLLTSRSSHQ